MFCTNCSAEIDQDAKFCPSCGAPVLLAPAEVVAPFRAAPMQYCTSCRAQILASATTCDRCGAAQVSGAMQSTIPTLLAAAPTSVSRDSFSNNLLMASIGRRGAALFIDSIIVILVVMLAGLVNENLGNVVIYFGYFAYFIVAEAVYSQTIGKKVVGIRTTTESGQSISWGQSFGRNLLLIIDYFPWIFPIVGPILMATSDENQRLGDRAAHTIVVKLP